MSQNSIKQAVESAQVICRDQNSVEDWPELKPLTRALSPAAPFPIEALGTILAPAAKQIHAAVKAPLAICCQSILAGATLAVQHLADVSIDGRVYPISNFFLTLGESGERKSGVDKWALRAHNDYEREKKLEYDLKLKEYQKKKALFDERRRALARGQKKQQTAKQLEKELEELGDEPEPPLQPYITTTDPTIEGLIKLFQQGQGTLGLFSDEGGKFFGSYSMNKDHQVAAISALSNLWDGAAIDRVRAGDFTKLYGRRLSISILVQPRIANILLANETARDQGILARFLIVYPDSTAGTRAYEDKDLSKDEYLIAYCLRISRCLRQLKPQNGARNELEPRTISLSEDAKSVWVALHDAIERQQKPDGKYAGIRAFASKSAEHALRIAAVLTLIDNPDATEIPVSKIDDAAVLISFYLDENLRLSEMGHTSAKYIQCEDLVDWLQKRKAKQGELISLVEIYQNGPSAIRDPKLAKFLMSILIRHGFVRYATEAVTYRGTRRKEVYEIRSAELADSS